MHSSPLAGSGENVTGNATAAEALLANDRHYVKAVTQLGDRQGVVAATDIVTARGIKLVARGTRIDSNLREKLSAHRLQPMLDHGLAAENPVTAESLARWTTRTIDEQPLWRHFATRSGDPNAMKQSLSRLHLPAPLAFKLTVAREQRPALFEHSVRVALLACYIGLRLGFPEARLQRLQLAALAHDLGELHTDPAILDPGHKVTDAERQFIYVHPITAWLFLRDIPDLPVEVARAVLHHQEKIDGSGYPNGLQGDAIEALARPLMVADTAESVLSRFADHRRLGTLLRLNMRKYDERAVSALHEALSGLPVSEPAAAAAVDPQPRLQALAALLSSWSAFRGAVGHATGTALQLDFLDARMRNLHSVLLQFGFDPDSFDALATLAQEDREVAAELALVIDELGFQLADMAREIDRREAGIRSALGDAGQIGFDDWRMTLRNTLPNA
jgi:HD-GYP domain-containing protein (c-di-GMP phosphodiesterase class II)